MFFRSSKECVALLIGLYKKNGAVSCVGFDFVLFKALYTIAQNLQTTCTMECRKVVGILGYPLGLDWVMGKFQ